MEYSSLLWSVKTILLIERKSVAEIEHYVIDSTGFFQALKRSYQAPVVEHLLNHKDYTESNYILGRYKKTNPDMGTNNLTVVTYHNGTSVTSEPYTLDDKTFEVATLIGT